MQLKLAGTEKCVRGRVGQVTWWPKSTYALHRLVVEISCVGVLSVRFMRSLDTQENILDWKVNLNWFQIIFSLSIVRPVLSENQWPWKWKWRHVSSLRQNAYATGWSCVVTRDLKMKTRSTMRAMLLSQQVLNRKKELDFDEIFAWNLFFAALFDS